MGTGAFFGRGDDLEAISELVARGERFVTLLGPGGVGKTRLARRFLELHGDTLGTTELCDLSSARTLEEVCGAVTRTLDLGASRTERRPEVERVGRAIAARGRTLLVLDNCEQAVDAIARALGAWRAIATEAFFVMTSREPLGVPGERVHVVPPLAVPTPGDDPQRFDAVQMFLDGVARARPGFVLDRADEASVAEIVRRLDGLPLAIELAAARAAVLGVPSILERLSRRFELLAFGPRELADRQRTMRAAIQWSWDLLSPVEQAVAARCSVFRGGFTVDAAEAIVDLGSSDESCIDVVHGLVQKSMLRSYQPPGSREVRLAMYDGIREFCAEELVKSGLDGAAIDRHAKHYARDGARWASELPTRRGAERMRTLVVELENLAAAHARALATLDQTTAVECMMAMVPALDAHGSLDEQLRLLDATLERFDDVRLLVARGEALATAGRIDEAIVDLERARAKKDRTTEGRAIGALGMAAWYGGEFEKAETTLSEALAFARKSGDTDLEATMLRRLANLGIDRRRLDDALEWLERARVLVARTGNRREEGPVLGTLFLTHYLARRHDEASEIGMRALRIFREVGDGHREAVTQGNLGILEHERERLEEARSLYEQCIRGARFAGDRRLLGHALGWLARLDHEQGRLDDARSKYVDAIDLLEDVGARRGRSLFLAARAALECDARRGDLAKRLLADAAKQAPEDDAHVAAANRVYGAYVNEEDAHVIDHLRALAAESEDVLFALRLFDRRLPSRTRPSTALRAPDAPALEIGDGGAWFRVPGGERVDLSRRRSLRLVLLALAKHRHDAPGQPLAVEALVKLGWPGERMMPKSGAMRAYASITRLRKLGLSELLISRSTGYLLDPRVDLTLS